MFYLFLLVLAVLSAGVYLVVFFQSVPGAAEERLGLLEPLPEDLGVWKPDASTEEGKSAERAGLRREQRHYFDEAKGKLFLQVRYRSLENDEIVRADPDRVIKRRRIRKPG
ncbi:MAG TPA: hypothetical protein VFQ61_33135 [Polyangiaceae bacterium]|nr:hypothetical protein [Polyangiaceae bacterium]